MCILLVCKAFPAIYFALLVFLKNFTLVNSNQILNSLLTNIEQRIKMVSVRDT